MYGELNLEILIIELLFSIILSNSRNLCVRACHFIQLHATPELMILYNASVVQDKFIYFQLLDAISTHSLLEDLICCG